MSKYNLEEDYHNQLMRLAYDESLTTRFEKHKPPKGKALVKLFFFDPQVPQDDESMIYIPKGGLIGTNSGMKDPRKTTQEAAKAEGPRAIVRVIKCGDIVGDAITKKDLEVSPLFSVPDDDIMGSSMNPDFSWEAQNMFKKNPVKGTSEVVTQTPERLPNWRIKWDRYRFSDQRKASVSFEFLYLIPQSKLLMPLPVDEVVEVEDPESLSKA